MPRTPGPRCTASTRADIWHPSTCNRFAVKDGFCKQHHPDEIKARQDASYAAYKNKMENTPLAKLQRSHDTLTAQVAALREALERIGDSIGPCLGEIYDEPCSDDDGEQSLCAACFSRSIARAALAKGGAA